MVFESTPIDGLFVLIPERYEDGRGFFARAWCAEEFAEMGLVNRLVQSNISFNTRSGTLRGMHYQAYPHGEVKIVRCTSGAIFDVAVDVRAGSPTHLQSFGIELTADNRKALYIPKGFAHGFLSLVDGAEVYYYMSSEYAPEYARGLRWNDPALGIVWPFDPVVINDRDANYPDYAPAADYFEVSDVRA